MRRVSSRFLTLVPAIVGVLLATACTASGGGTLSPSASVPCAPGAGVQGSAMAPTFGFHATSTVTTDGLVSTFSGDFTDACAGVRLLGNGSLSPAPVPPQAPPTMNSCLAGLPSYTSQDPRHQGTGTFLLVACSQFSTDPSAFVGQSIGGDFLLVSVVSGPYAGYGVFGPVQNGNLIVTP